MQRRAYWRAYYRAHRAERLAYITFRQCMHRAWLNLYKEAHGCIDCGSLERLEFDHRDPRTKKYDVMSRAVYAISVAPARYRKVRHPVPVLSPPPREPRAPPEPGVTRAELWQAIREEQARRQRGEEIEPSAPGCDGCAQCQPDADEGGEG